MTTNTQHQVRAGRSLSMRAILLLLLLVAVLPSLVVQAGIYYYWLRTNQAREVQSNNELARSLALTFDTYVRNLGQQEAAMGAAITAKWPYTVDEMNSLLRAGAEGYPALNAFLLVNPQGVVIASSDTRLIGLVVKDRQYFQSALQTRGFVLSDLLEGRADPNPIFVVARAVYNGDKLEGVISGSVNPDRLAEATVKLPRQGERNISFFDRRGVLVFRQPTAPLTWYQRRNAESGDLLKQALAGKEAEGTLRLAGEDQDMIGVRIPITDLGWVVGTSEPTSVITHPLVRTLLLVGEINAAAVLFSLVAAWVISRGMIRGILHLRSHALAIGNGSIEQATVTDRITEIRDLARAFNEMIALRTAAEEELKRTAADLKRSNTDLEQFAYVASHDLQEPLRMVRGNLQLIEENLHDKLDDTTMQAMGFAMDGAARMQALIKDLLAYSRVGRQGKGFAKTDMEAVFNQAVGNLQASIEESAARIEHDPLPTVTAEESLMSQLLQNLLGNAIKYRSADKAPVIHVGAKRDAGAWVFWVRDNGIGIKPDDSERVFMVFQRLHTRQQYPGTGIGLAICKKIIEYHGGRIWVESEIGQGSTFYFSIPDRE